MWGKLHMPFGSGIAVAVVQASCYSSDSAPSLGLPYVTDAALKIPKEKKKKRERERRKVGNLD